MEALFVITARGGSKGIPGKNIKALAGKPLICYTVDVARSLTTDENICVSTDAEEIKKVVEDQGLQVPFLRPADLAGDNAGSYEVLLHAVEFYRKMGRQYQTLVLLQPTSPFRTAHQVKEAMDIFRTDTTLEMVVSVRETKDNPYFSLFEENNDGLLQRSKPGDYVRRQDCPKVYAYNGAIYVISIEALMKKKLSQFERIRKYVMDEVTSIDIDTPQDWLWAEYAMDKIINKA